MEKLQFIFKFSSDGKLEKAKIEGELEAIKLKEVFKSFQELSPENADSLMKVVPSLKSRNIKYMIGYVEVSFFKKNQ